MSELNVQVRHPKHKAKRDERKAAGLCINHENHGPATHGVLCAACREKHRRSR